MKNTGNESAVDAITWSEICELSVLGALGWGLGFWIWKHLPLPLAVSTASFAVVALVWSFGLGESLKQTSLIFGVGGGWFLLLADAPFAAANWVILWVVPGASKDRLAILLAAVSGMGTLLLLSWAWLHWGRRRS